MALHTRPELFGGAHTRIDTTQLTRASRLLPAVHGHVRRAEQGDRRRECVRARSRDPSGRRAEAPRHVRDHDARVGRRPTAACWCWASTRGGTRCAQRLEELGYELDDERFLEVFARFKELRDRKKVVDDRDIAALATAAHDHAPARWTMVQMQVPSGTHLIPTATVKLRAADGTTKVGSGTGDGPVDASCQAINAVVGDDRRAAGIHHALRVRRDRRARGGNGTREGSSIRAARSSATARTSTSSRRRARRTSTRSTACSARVTRRTRRA